MIRLTDEEIIYLNVSKKLDWHGYTADPWAKRVAKAQLKKVVELFESHNRLWLDKGKKYRGIPDELWQALLEEVK